MADNEVIRRLHRFTQMEFTEKSALICEICGSKRRPKYASQNERDLQTYAIIGAAMEVHRGLGHGFLEAVYHDAIILEVIERSIPHQTEVKIIVSYKGKSLPSCYIADLICFGEVMVELKAQARLTSADEAQVINYLKATGLSKALLINFGAPSLEFKRLVYTHNPQENNLRKSV